MTEMTDAYEWQGRTMVGSDGEKIGKISDIYEDPETGKPEWATVNTGLFDMKSNSCRWRAPRRRGRTCGPR